MQKIPLNLAQPGMILAKPVARDDGIVVLAQGSELSESILSRLEKMEVENIVVEGEPLKLDGLSSGGAAFSVRLERLEHLFRKFSGDTWMNNLKRLFREYFQLKAASTAAMLAAQAAAKLAAAEPAPQEETKDGEEPGK